VKHSRSRHAGAAERPDRIGVVEVRGAEVGICLPLLHNRPRRRRRAFACQQSRRRCGSPQALACSRQARPRRRSQPTGRALQVVLQRGPSTATARADSSRSSACAAAITAAFGDPRRHVDTGIRTVVLDYLTTLLATVGQRCRPRPCPEVALGDVPQGQHRGRRHSASHPGPTPLPVLPCACVFFIAMAGVLP